MKPKRSVTSIYIRPDLWAWLRDHCDDNGATLSGTLEAWIERLKARKTREMEGD